MIKKIFSFLLVLICLWSCKAEKVTIPAYIQIDDYTVKVADSSNNGQGTSNQKFTDMLVFANGQSSGTFPVGKPVPVITNGSATFLIRGVVEVNGVSGVRADYELMQGCDTVITVTTGKIIKIKPVFEYFPGIVFKWLENFDATAGSSLTQQDTTAKIDIHGFSGKCLIMRPNATTTTTYVDKSTPVNLPSGGVGVYMELNFQSNVNINVNIKGDISGTTLGVGGVYPSAGWNKIYLDLTEQVSNLHENNNLYHLTFYASYDPNVGPNYARIDNIKVISKQ